ncbi:MAG: methyl-accepting chemotaxis sensory transducer [Myxococcales bacterium]|jgi:hypothetical protein|nr:methyl-accepting chemotaxis sensory transducer [Myxococcales bacterium]
MSLSQTDAVRILRFCLAADDSGNATVRDDGSCLVTIALCRSSYEVRTFEGATFEESLRRAGGAGALKAECVDKQIAFVSRRDPSDEPAPRTPTPSMTTTAKPVDVVPANDTEANSPFLELAGALGALLHETQRERGVSTLFVASRGRLLGPELTKQRERLDVQRAALATLVQAHRKAPASVWHRLDRAQTLFGQLGTVRAGIEDLVTSVPQVISYFSGVNVELLSALDAFMVTGLGGPARAGALACVSLLYAKEKTGIERAQLTDAFFVDRFAEGQRISVAAAIAAQSSYLHIFSAAAPRAAEQMLRRSLASPEVADVQRMESVIYSANEAGFGIDASTWFAAISRKIDLLDDVSSTVLKMLRDKR